MIIQILSNGLSAGQNLILLITTLVTVLMSLTVHEYAHGLVSYLLGDPTAKNAGRLTFNPKKHINPLGMLCMLICGFGWAKPVPVDPRYYKNPKRGMAITALAGPLVNLIIGISVTATVPLLVTAWETGAYKELPLLKYMTESVYETVSLVLYIVLYYNLLFAVFNMLPIPPFDGSRLLFAFLPDKYYFGVMKYEIFLMLAVFFMISSGMLTGVFEFCVDGIIKLVSTAVVYLFNALAELILILK